MPTQRYQLNLERLKQRLPEGHEIVTVEPTKMVIRRTRILYTGCGVYGQVNAKNLSVRYDHQLVQHDLTISLNEKGQPVFEKSLVALPKNADQAVWRERSEKYLNESFDVSYRDSGRVKLVLNFTYFYWEKREGELVVLESN